MRAYSLDLRQHLIDAVHGGTDKAEAARIFGVSRRTINRYLKQVADRESLAAKRLPGRERHLPTAQHAALDAQLRAHDDATLAEHCALWAGSHGVQLSPATMCRAIQRLGWTRKKRRWWPPSKTRPNGSGGATRSATMTPPSSSSSTSRAPTWR